MKLTADNKLKKLIVVGDRVLIKPAKQNDKPIVDSTCHRAFRKRKKFKAVTSPKYTPGYPLPLPADEDDLWKGKEEQVKSPPAGAGR